MSRRLLAPLLLAALLVGGLSLAAPAAATPPGRNGELVGLGGGGLELMSPDGQWLGATRERRIRYITDVQTCPNGVHLMFDAEYFDRNGIPRPAMFVARWNGTDRHRLGSFGFSPACLGNGRYDYLGLVGDDVAAVKQARIGGGAGRTLFVLPGLTVGVPIRVSPDHRWIAFPANPTTPPETGGIWLAHPDGSGLHPLPLPADTAINGDFDWAPDSHHIIFSAHGPYLPDGESSDGEYSVAPDGTGLRRLAPGGNGLFAPTGTHIFYVAPHRPPYTLMRADGTGRTTIPVAGPAFAWQPITTETASTLSFRIKRKDRWTFTVTGRVGPVSERLQRFVVTAYERRSGGHIDVQRHLSQGTARGFRTWLYDVRPYHRDTCTVRLRFLGDPVSLPVSRVVHFPC